MGTFLPCVSRWVPTRSGQTIFHPTSAANADTELLTLVRADADFKDYPQVVTVAVIDPRDRPVPGAQVFSFLQHFDHLQNLKWNSPDWRCHDVLTADAHGCATRPYDDFRAAGVRDTERKLIGFTTASPAQLQKGTATIRLQPECLLRGTLVCQQLIQGAKPLGWSDVCLELNGWQIAEYDTVSGQYEFPVAPGRYSIRAYGGEFENEARGNQRTRRPKRIPNAADRIERFVPGPVAGPAGPGIGGHRRVEGPAHQARRSAGKIRAAGLLGLLVRPLRGPDTGVH